MKNITTVIKDPRILAILLAAAFGLSATTSNAADSVEAYDNITVVSQVSANGAKRLARHYLNENGFNYGVGPGAARIKSITRDGDTWILQVRYNLGESHILNQRATLYINADTAMVSEKAPERKPQQVAAQ